MGGGQPDGTRWAPSRRQRKILVDLTVLIFLLVYIALAFGHLPGLKVDRTGAAVIGAMAMMATERISPQAAWDAIDYRTAGLLFGLMVVSAAFVVSGFYGWTARRVATLNVRPPVLLAILVGVSGLRSSVLTNDVVVVAMTPLLVAITLSQGLNPIPWRRRSADDPGDRISARRRAWARPTPSPNRSRPSPGRGGGCPGRRYGRPGPARRGHLSGPDPGAGASRCWRCRT